MPKEDHNPSSPPTAAAPSADALAAAARKAAGKGRPPVHLWNPPFCGDIDMRIARDGTWFYLGTPIGRHRMVELFASILRRDDDSYFLVTPVEKVGIQVDDAPFVAIDFTRTAPGPGQSISFTPNVGDTVTAGPAHPIRVVLAAATGEPTPYVMVRDGLEARIDRKSFYRLVDLATEEELSGTRQLGVRSGGMFFPFIASADLARDNT